MSSQNLISLLVCSRQISSYRTIMIRCVLVVNNQGKPRLVRYYYEVPLDKQKTILKNVFNLVSKRSDETSCCFADAKDLFGEDVRIVYRHFATLYFVFVVDSSESELGMLDLIQVFVQVLDSCFENVCELDLIYHFDRVNAILDEVVMAGMVLETNVDAILNEVNESKKLENEGTGAFGFDLSTTLSSFGTR